MRRKSIPSHLRNESRLRYHAITTLLKAHRADLLQGLFGEVIVPIAVHAELRAIHPKLPAFVTVQPVSESAPQLPETAVLGTGEIEAIRLARETRADLFLTDDRKAGAVAARLGLKRMGLLGLLLLAKRRNLISSVTEIMSVLESEGGLYLSETVKAEATRLAGE